MPQICEVHNCEMNQRQGQYWAYWSCPTKTGFDQQTGKPTWCKWRPPKGNTPAAKFNQELNQSASQMDAGKKDATITRLAIAKSLIEAGRKYENQTLIEAQAWEAWVNGQRVKDEQSPVPQEYNEGYNPFNPQ